MTRQRTAAQNGFRYKTASSGSALSQSGVGLINIDAVGEVDTITLRNEDQEGTDVTPLFQQLKDNGGYLEISNGDFTKVLALTIESQAGDDQTVSTGETTIAVSTATTTIQVESLIENQDGLDLQNNTDVFVKIIPNAANFIRDFNGVTGSVITSALTIPVAGLSAGSSGIITQSHIEFADGTTQDTAHRGENTATFSIRASSAISTGSKTDTLFRVPYNATFKQLQIRSGATGGFTGSFTIAGSDFGAVTTNSIHGATLGTLGFTASSTSFDFASATAGDFLFFNVGSNGAGATTVQAFVTFERR